MTAHYEKMLTELETSLNDLNGDILAWDTFFRCYENVVGDFGNSVSLNYLQRLQDYIEQHMQEIQKVIYLMAKDTSFE